MAKLLIVYVTNYGNTQKMAERVAEGARSIAGTEVELKAAADTTQDDLKASDAILLGCPVHMGSPAAGMKKFIDEVCGPLWIQDALAGKVGAVFATGSGFGSSGGGVELTLLALLSNLAELGMLIVPLPKNTPGYAKGGLQWGPYGRSAGEQMEQIGVSDANMEAAYHHGANVARVASAIAGKSVFTS